MIVSPHPSTEISRSGALLQEATQSIRRIAVQEAEVCAHAFATDTAGLRALISFRAASDGASGRPH